MEREELKKIAKSIPRALWATHIAVRKNGFGAVCCERLQGDVYIDAHSSEIHRDQFYHAEWEFFAVEELKQEKSELEKVCDEYGVYLRSSEYGKGNFENAAQLINIGAAAMRERYTGYDELMAALEGES